MTADLTLVAATAATAATIVVESAVFLRWLRTTPRDAILCAASINLMTVPAANYLFEVLLARATPALAAFTMVEAGVIAVEAPLVQLIAGLAWPQSLRLSIAANVCSMALSVLFW